MEREDSTREERKADERRPARRGRQGEAEGFEASERMLRDRAEYGEPEEHTTEASDNDR